MEERREVPQGRRQGDRRFPVQPVPALLVLIVLLQVVLLVLHSRSPSQQQPPAASSSAKPETMADALLKLGLVSAEPEVRQLVGQLGQALNSETPQASFAVTVDNVRVESATGIGEVVVAARLRNSAPVPLQDVLCRLQLRDAAGALLYQATGERVGSSGGAWLPGESERVRFLVDNPPKEFSRVTFVMDRLDFAVEGFPAERHR